MKKDTASLTVSFFSSKSIKIVHQIKKRSTTRNFKLLVTFLKHITLSSYPAFLKNILFYTNICRSTRAKARANSRVSFFQKLRLSSTNRYNFSSGSIHVFTGTDWGTMDEPTRMYPLRSIQTTLHYLLSKSTTFYT
jgi:hypothetical protein